MTEVTVLDPAAEARDLCGPDAVVEGAEMVEMTLPAEPWSVGVARRYVHRRWAQLEDDTLDDVELIVSELVGNAVRHGRPEIVFRLRVDPFAVDVAVLDHGSDLPPMDGQRALDTETSGRGLRLVDQLANRWGVEAHDHTGAKTVWASVRR